MVLLATLQRFGHVEFVIFEPRPLAGVVLPHASKQGGEVKGLKGRYEQQQFERFVFEVVFLKLF